MVCIKVTTDKFTFDDWVFDDWGADGSHDAVHKEFHDAWEKVEAAILRTVTSTLQGEFEQEGIDVYLTEGEVEGVPYIHVVLCFLTIDDGHHSPFSVDVPLVDLVAEMIDKDPVGARNLLPAMREIVARLEAVPEAGGQS